MSFCAKGISAALSPILVLTLGFPSAALADQTDPAADAAADQTLAQREASDVDALLDAGDYEKGDVIVMTSNNMSAIMSDAGLDGAKTSSEKLLTASSSAYESAIGEDAPGKVGIYLVHSDAFSTETLITKLLKDERVLSAEPNYTQPTEEALAPADETAAADETAPATPAAPAATPATPAAAATPATPATPAATPATPATTPATKLGTLDAKSSTVQTVSKLGSNVNITATSKMKDLSSYQWAYATNGSAMTPSKTVSMNVPNWNNGSNVSNEPVVAVVDSGVDYNHPDLKNVMMDMTPYNKGTTAGKYGYNGATFTDLPEDGSDDPMDETVGHGTHVAGIMAASWNGKGVSGELGGAKIVAVKIANATLVSTLAALRGYAYLSQAMDKGLNLVSVNNSWSSAASIPALAVAVDQLGERGAVSCFASGNENKDITPKNTSAGSVSYSKYAIIVDALSPAGKQAFYSNYGQGITDVFAPGSSILSTWTSYAEEEGQVTGNYLPFADPDAVLYEDFAEKGTASASAKGIRIYEATKDSEPFDALKSGAKQVGSLTDQASFDAGTGSWKIAASGHSYYEMLIPATAEQLANVSNLGLMVYTSAPDGDVSAGVAIVNNNNEAEHVMSEDAASAGDWMSIGVDMANYEDLDGKGIAVRDGYISVMIEVDSDAAGSSAGDSAVYLDNIGMGQNVVNYKIEHGTSMATPATTAAVAMAANQLDLSGLTAAERAQALVHAVKSSVTQKDDLTKLCSSGGFVNFNELGKNVVPVIDASAQSGSSLVVTGANFGETPGKLTLSGSDLSIQSWTSTRVEAALPDQIKSDVRVLALTTAAGASACDVLAVTGTDTDIATLFEESIDLSACPEILKASGYRLAGLGGKLYFLLSAEGHKEALFSTLVSYDISSKEWSNLAELPMKASNVSLVAYHNRLLAYGNAVELDPDEGYVARAGTFAYDPAANAWSKLSIKGMQYGSTLANVDGQLYTFGGYDIYDFSRGIGETQATVNRVDLASGSCKKVASMPQEMAWPQVTTSSGYACVTNGATVDNADAGTANQAIYVATVDALTGKMSFSSDLVSQILYQAAINAGYTNNFVCTACSDGLLVTAYNAARADDSRSVQSTYLFRKSMSGQFVSRVQNKVPSMGALFQAATLAYKGRVYVIGSSHTEASTVIMRSTSVESTETLGDALPLPGAKVTLSQTSYTYTGKVCKPTVTSVTTALGEKVPATAYTVSYVGNVNAGTAKVVLTSGAGTEGTCVATFAIKKAAQSKAKIATSSLKAKRGSLSGKISVKNVKDKAKLGYSKVKKGSSAYLTVTKSGKIKVSKKAKRGKTYSVKVKVAVKATANYKARTLTKTIKVKVK